MPLPRHDTTVTFPSGRLTGESTVSFVESADGRALVLTDSTPFHPVDPRWPDQGPDVGVLTVGGVSLPVLDCVIGATDGSALFVGDDVPVRRGEPGWAFVVVHAVAAGGPAIAEAERVTLAVDPDHRAALSAGHTGCHLASLALNGALAGRWRRPVEIDSLGRANFDQLAIVSSRIVPNGSVDTYRLGKSLRKKGFDSAGLADDLADVQAVVNDVLAGWVSSGAIVEIESAGPLLTDHRFWTCILPEGAARIPCGGTHLSSLAEVSAIVVELGYDGMTELVMTTEVTGPS